MKRGRNKLFVILGIFIISLLIVSVIITAADNGEIVAEIQDKLSDTAYEYVENFAQEKGINPEEINNITEVDFNSLPKEVNIENVNDANLAIYQIDYNISSEEQDKIFVITYAVEQLKSQGDLIISQDKREFLNFGFNREKNSSGFLETATGVEGSSEKGYVMMREGSITGISTNLEIIDGEGNLEIIIYKNGEKISFGNTFVIDSAGIKEDYDIQSKDTISFEPGDTISLYVQSSEGIFWKDVTTLVEITTH
ncbi:hypothetical protein M0R19_01220 [Candidatus Pacearchaeota archaeon]|jgi:hypothetical protein|nr:hypothetical protein [Candidatus Pacearchaeota archaeon]